MFNGREAQMLERHRSDTQFTGGDNDGYDK